MRPWPFSHSSRLGGKSRLRQESGAGGSQAGLVVFYREQVVRPAFLHEVPGRVAWGVQRVGGD